ncbi:MAG TPA: flippase-like domain-containing protein [Chitinophagaceae bacterium]|nr:flippase-like domain-containing protein [Chitinophagaceae bacterium]
MLKLIGKKIRIIKRKTYWREILALLMLLFAIVFFRSEAKELNEIAPRLGNARLVWVLSGLLVTVVYIILQSGIYRKCFSAIRMNLSWGHSVELFLKRNLIGVFLPAGNLSALAYSPAEIRKQGFSQADIHQASGLYGFASMLTVVIVGLPVMIYLLVGQSGFGDAWLGLGIVVGILAFMIWGYQDLKSKKNLYQFISRKIPSAVPIMDEIFAGELKRPELVSAIIYSLFVELAGVLHIYLAMLALGVEPGLAAAASSYMVAVIMMIVSPFLRGLGVVELSMVYVLQRFGYSSSVALSIAVLYRVFEFWIPLGAGLFAFAWKGRKFMLRLVPVLLTLLLGVINIISVITPPVHQRMRLLREYLPLEVIHASNFMVLFVGLALLVTSAFLVRGFRNAWLLAMLFAVFSLAGHLTKAFDYEEAAIAGLTVLVLAFSGNQYRIRSSNKWMMAGLKTALVGITAVLLFGFISFYFIDVKHFGQDFTFSQSLEHSLKIFLLVKDDSLHPLTRFGIEFVWFIRIIGFLIWAFLLFSVIKPHLKLNGNGIDALSRARLLVSQYGNSSVDYFKLYHDKIFFFSEVHDAFVAYRVSGGFAIVLEEPVCAEEYKVDVLREFDQNCHRMGLKTAFYRVDENSMPWFSQLKMNKLLIGQEAILDTRSFSLEGRDKKSLRNGLNSLQKKGYQVSFVKPPHDPEFLKKLHKVSDEWLQSYHKEEMIFSQGMFDEKEISEQELIILEDQEENVKAFLNIIPDHAEDECTYDLIRKTSDAPPAAMDALIVALVEYAKEKDLLYINLGLVPMTGITKPENTAESIIKIASARIRRFWHYRGLREFKEKYATYWENKYLVYENDFDLLQLPLALSKVMKP